MRILRLWGWQGSGTDRCPPVTHGAEVRPARPRPAPRLEPSGAQWEAARRGRGRLSTWRLAPAWPGPRGRAASPAPSPPSQRLPQRRGHDAPRARPPAARGSTLTYPRPPPHPASIPQSTPGCPPQALGFPCDPLSSHRRGARGTPAPRLWRPSHHPGLPPPQRPPAAPRAHNPCSLQPLPVAALPPDAAGLGSHGDGERLGARKHAHTQHTSSKHTQHTNIHQNKHTSNTHN